jgi:hypothetical protein
MGFSLRVGARVRHRTLGIGRILATRHEGYELLVEFPKLAQWVRARDLMSEDRITGAQREVQQIPPPGERSTKAHAGSSPARAILEAMRLGIAPPVGIERFTVGRLFEVAAVRDWLRDEAEGALVLEGAYGAGKSHLLRYISHDALSLGFAVAHTSVDPTEGVLTVPRRAYAHLVRGLLVPVGEAVVGLESALERASHVPAALEAVRDHPYLGPALMALSRGTLPETAWAVLRGERTRGDFLPPFYDHQTAANLACNLLSGLSYLLAAAFDLRGLLLLFDEVETAPHTLYAYERVHAKNLLRGLVLTASDDDILLTEPVLREGDSFVGAETGLLFSGHLKHRYLHAVPCRLKVLFAVTPDTLWPVFRGWRQTVPRLGLEPLSEPELRALFDLTCDLYREAFGCDLGPARPAVYRLLCERVPGGEPRSFLKGAVELLDFSRHYPGQVPGESLRQR